MKVFKCVSLSVVISLICVSMALADVTADSESSAAAVASVGGSKTSVNVSPTQSLEQTFEAGERPFPIPGQIEFPMMPGYFGENNKPGHQFIPLDKLMMYDTTWSVSEAKQMLKSKTFGKTANIVAMVPKVGESQYSSDIICTKMKFDTELYNVKQLAFGTVNATNKDSISADVLAKVLVESSKYGATHVQFLAEGTNTELNSEGVGIGFNYTSADKESISTGGTGWSKGWAGYQNMPWMQFVVLHVIEKPKPEITSIKKVEKPVEEETLTPLQQMMKDQKQPERKQQLPVIIMDDSMNW